jgi:hypothetical protein
MAVCELLNVLELSTCKGKVLDHYFNKKLQASLS